MGCLWVSWGAEVVERLHKRAHGKKSWQHECCNAGAAASSELALALLPQRRSLLPLIIIMSTAGCRECVQSKMAALYNAQGKMCVCHVWSQMNQYCGPLSGDHMCHQQPTIADSHASMASVETDMLPKSRGCMD